MLHGLPLELHWTQYHTLLTHTITFVIIIANMWARNALTKYYYHDIFFCIQRLRQQDGSQASSQACREQRRMWFAIIFCLLTLSTASAAGLTAHTRRQYVKSVLEARQDLQPLLPSSTIRTGLSGGLFYHSTNRQFISTKVQNAQFMYGLSAAILVCTTVLTVGVGLLWLFAEFWVWPQEVRMRQMRRQTRRLRNMRREMERAENFTIEDLSPNPVTTEGSVQIMETAV